jgi:DNA-binding MarR family transcriptional regulator
VPSSAATVDIETAARLRAAIGRLSRRLRPTTAGTAAGLTPTRVTVLLDVVRQGRARLADVASAEGINPTMLSRVVADLAEAGLIERANDELDRRTVWVKATPTGRRLAERMRRERTDAVNIALEGLTEAERQMVQRALPALEALAEQLGSERG